MNCVVEDVVLVGKCIIIDVVELIIIEDVVGILCGGDFVVMDFLCGCIEDNFCDLFMFYVEMVLDSFGVYWMFDSVVLNQFLLVMVVVDYKLDLIIYVV